jgi:iron complex outermembrane recepter protein
MLGKPALFVSAAIGLAIAAPAFAQDGPSSRPEEEASAERGDIIVTARRRQESILKVPVVENVVSAETLEQVQITNLETLATRVPGLNTGEAVLSIGPQISLRGVGTASLDAGIDQSISLNVDGLSLTQGLAYGVAVFDLAQAEVLKGPQALFFGKNSPAGVISLRSNDPGSSLEIVGRLGYEVEAREKRAELILSGPVTDTLGLRLATMGSFQDGHFRNKATALPGFGGLDPKDDRFAPARNFIVRGTALFEPTSEFTARLKVNYSNDYVDGNAGIGQYAGCNEGVGAPLGIPFINPNEDCEINRDIYVIPLDPAAFPLAVNGGQPFFKLEQKFGTLDFSYDTANDMSLVSITGFYRADSSSLIPGTIGGFAQTPLSASNNFHRQDFTQEFRLDTDFASPLNFTLGAFYQNGEIYNRIILGGNTAIGLPPLLRSGSHEVSIESISGFGQLRFQVTPQIELAGGVRYTDETRSDEVLDLAGGNVITSLEQLYAATPVDISLPGQGKFSTRNWSPEFTITWTPTDDFTVFAAAKQGYKSGSFTITTPSAEEPFGDERVRGGEVGIKARLADRQLNVNLAGYYYKYDGLQVGINEPAVGGLPVIRTINAAGAKVYGVDFDMSYQPYSVEGLTLNAAVNYNHARFSEFVNAPCYGGQTVQLGCNLNPIRDANGNIVPNQFNEPTYTGQDLSGTPLSRAPDWTLTASADYEMDAGENNYIRFGASGRYSSRFLRILSLDNRADVYQPSYAMFDANVAFGAKDERWEIALIGNNITNEYISSTCTTFNGANGQVLGGQFTGTTQLGPAGLDELTCNVQRGRQLWLRLTVRN